MNWEELKHEINMKVVEFRRNNGKHADVLVLGKKEYAILEANKSSGDIDVDSHTQNSSFWSMNVHLDKSKESYLELVGKKVNFLKIIEYPFTSYRMKVGISMPAELKESFVSFLDSQNTSSIGVRIVGGGRELNNPDYGEDLVRYQVSVKGKNKDMVIAWVNYLYEIEKAYTIELICDVCGQHWVECRDNYYNSHLEGGKNFCAECKIYE